MTRRPSRHSPRMQVVRESDGSLRDESTGLSLSRADLRDHIRDGGFFEARRRHNGAPCTNQVLREILEEGFVRAVTLGALPDGQSRLGDPLELLGRLAQAAELWMGGGPEGREARRLEAIEAPTDGETEKPGLGGA